MITALDHIHVYAAEPEATIAFYVELLGGERLGALPSGHGSENHFVLLGGQILVVSDFPPGLEPTELPDVGDGARRTGHGVAHFGLQTTDLDGMRARLEAAGVEVHSQPRESGSIRFVYFSAPDGVVIELVEIRVPPHLAPLWPAYTLFNRAVHAARRAFAKQLF